MKHFYAFLLTLFSYSVLAQMSIGTSYPDPSAQFEISSIDKGLLIPRVSYANRPGSPGKNPAVAGLMIYQTDHEPGFYAYHENAWEKLVRQSEITTPSYFSGLRVNPESITLTGSNFAITPIAFDSLMYSKDIQILEDKTSIKVTKGGIYQITYSITPSSSTGHFFTHIVINNNIARQYSTMGLSSRLNTSGNHMIRLAANSTVKLALGTGIIPISGSVHFMDGFHVASFTLVKLD
ncbi:hypothetical protein BWI96_07350 [Siphonobacter sp. SORGH_AS_0500]|uniref:hypothetical protein n=1 Tax=Siphonobacter sp. SORGH_AS_0500 TaxID=1864824 RepID=UPI000CA79E3E|nr:hypothetical protein [Siphonobacter sp. SORGH_AS_0500]PKK37162.1 hypothetical protein BWI96_07350 [Siphonobacter sp. SORGH_AS_0500]